MTQSPRLQFSLRTIFVITTVAALLASYAGSYYHLSRRGMREAKIVGYVDGFYYIPVADSFSQEGLSDNNFRARLFAPANWVDRQFFGGIYPMAGSTLF